MSAGKVTTSAHRVMPLRQRGFSLPELLTVLIILPVFMLVATHLFHSTFRTTHGAEEVAAAQAAFDSAARALRADLWSARSFASDAGGVVTVTPLQGKPITWTARGGALVRQGADVRRWAGPERFPIALERDDQDLVLRLKTGLQTDEVRIGIPPPLQRRSS